MEKWVLGVYHTIPYIEEGDVKCYLIFFVVPGIVNTQFTLVDPHELVIVRRGVGVKLTLSFVDGWVNISAVMDIRSPSLFKVFFA